ncbi:MAG TPA: SRPBCC family protein [Blastocatellia bacterium]|nr:SRPBCC family protein [Blastocatellia bacterium]
MAVLSATTRINAPINRCFDLARSIDLHVAAALQTGERAISGTTRGLIAIGEEVTWRARHFGFTWEMTSRITRLDPPSFFQDRMTAGPFASFEHDHRFEEVAGVTLMRDEIRFRAPFGPAGVLVDLLILRPHLRRFLLRRNSRLRAVAESVDEWEQYVA